MRDRTTNGQLTAPQDLGAFDRSQLGDLVRQAEDQFVGVRGIQGNMCRKVDVVVIPSQANAIHPLQNRGEVLWDPRFCDDEVPVGGPLVSRSGQQHRKDVGGQAGEPGASLSSLLNKGDRHLALRIIQLVFCFRSHPVPVFQRAVRSIGEQRIPGFQRLQQDAQPVRVEVLLLPSATFIKQIDGSGLFHDTLLPGDQQRHLIINDLVADDIVEQE